MTVVKQQNNYICSYSSSIANLGFIQSGENCPWPIQGYFCCLCSITCSSMTFQNLLWYASWLNHAFMFRPIFTVADNCEFLKIYIVENILYVNLFSQLYEHRKMFSLINQETTSITTGKIIYTRHSKSIFNILFCIMLLIFAITAK